MSCAKQHSPFEGTTVAVSLSDRSGRRGQTVQEQRVVVITRSSGFARRTLVAFLAGALILMAASRSAEASPFVINLLGSSGGGGGASSSSPVGSAGFGMGGASTTGIP